MRLCRVRARIDAVAIRDMAYVALSFNHRLIDGAVADHFMVGKDLLKKTSAVTDRVGKHVGWTLPILTVVLLAGILPDGTRPATRGIVINEVLARNRFTSFDEDEHSSDWVEIHNSSSRYIDLTGFGLSNDPRDPNKWRFPEVDLSPGGFLVVWCSGKDRSSTPGDTAGSLHTNFRLAASGQTVLVSRADGELLDAVVLTPQTEDRSFGRSPNGDGDFFYHLSPTPGAPNTGPVSRETIPSRPRFDPPGGFYRDSVELTITAHIPANGIRIRYTVDGSTPTRESLVYDEPVVLHPNEWQAGTVVRAAAFIGEERVTQIETQSYFFDAGEYELPTLSVAMDPPAFRRVHLSNANRGKRFERGGHVEIFDATGLRAVASGMGLRLHGVAGRSGGLGTKKSYRMYFRDVYGAKKLKYRAIPDTETVVFDRLVLRANMEDAFRDKRRATYIRDQLMRELAGDMEQITSHGAWYNLFVNMEYRGVYNTVERMDRFFFRSYFPEESSGWDVVNGGGAIEGDRIAWDEMRRFFTENDLGVSTLFDEAVDRIDIENFTDYMILSIWVQNHDWPHKNYFAARPRRPDGKWIFLCWDGELGFALHPPVHDADTFERACTRGGSPIGDILVSLLRNPDYQRFFLRRFEHHLKGALKSDNVIARIRRIRYRIESDMRKEVQATFAELDPNLWKRNVDEVEIFARHRGGAIWNHVFSSPRITIPRVASVTPNEAVAGSRTVLELKGYGFTADTVVELNGVSASVVGIPSSSSIRVLLPGDARVTGSPDITASDHDSGSYTTRGLLKVMSPGVDRGGE